MDMVGHATTTVRSQGLRVGTPLSGPPPSTRPSSRCTQSLCASLPPARYWPAGRSGGRHGHPYSPGSGEQAGTDLGDAALSSAVHFGRAPDRHCDVSCSLRDALALMRTHDFSQLPYCHDELGWILVT